MRVLAALRSLTNPMDGLDLSPAESALLCLAPLLREAVFARSGEHMAEHQPLSLEDAGSSHGDVGWRPPAEDETAPDAPVDESVRPRASRRADVGARVTFFPSRQRIAKSPTRCPEGVL